MNSSPFRIQHLTSTISTNDDLRAAAQAGAEDGLVIMADAQTGGRGSRGRSWFSPAGNLYVSLLLYPSEPQSELGLYSFLTSLALAKAMPEQLAQERVKLKWPNDVLVDGAKIAGILLESFNTPQGQALIIGMGVNIAHAPVDTPYRATSLADLGFDTQKNTPKSLLMRFLPAFHSYRQELGASGFGRIREAWLAQASGLGEGIVVRLSDSELNGVFKGIDPTGRLLLREAGGKITPIASGEVFPSLRYG